MKLSLNILLALMAVMATPAFAEQYVLHVRFEGNPCAYDDGGDCNYQGLTMTSVTKITDGSGNSLPGLKWKCLTGQPNCKDGAEKNDTIDANGVITSHVYRGKDEVVAPVTAGQQIIIDANLTAYNGAVKHVTLVGKADMGQFGEGVLLDSPDSSGVSVNVGFVAWLTRNK